MNDTWWTVTEGDSLTQGDLLPDCCLPVFIDPVPNEGEPSEREVDVLLQRLIVITQSCDLVNNKVEFVALCPVHTLAEFEKSNPMYTKKKNWNEVRKGKVNSIHMIAGPTSCVNTDSLVVDFGQIVSLPFGYLCEHSHSLGERHRLKSPFLEHFSQAFARFFMRVGLPSSIDDFK